MHTDNAWVLRERGGGRTSPRPLIPSDSPGFFAHLKERMTMIHKCTCQHEYQDKRYGTGRRIFNEMAKSAPGTIKGRCTVCKNEISVGSPVKPTKGGGKK